MAQRVKLQNDPRAAPSQVTQPFFPRALSTDFTLRWLLDAARLPGRTEWPQLHRIFFSTPRGEKLVKRPRGGIGSPKGAAGNEARCQMAFSAVVLEVNNVSVQANRAVASIRICSSSGNMARTILDRIIQTLKKSFLFFQLFLKFAYATYKGKVASIHLAMLL